MDVSISTSCVVVDGVPVLSCLVLAQEVAGSEIRTVEGMADGPIIILFGLSLEDPPLEDPPFHGVEADLHMLLLERGRGEEARAGADRALTMDMHAAQIQGFFDVPVDQLMATEVICEYFLKEKNLDNFVIVAADVEQAEALRGASAAGAVKASPVARRLADRPSWKPAVKSGYLRRYAQAVTSACTGAVFRE